MSAPAESYIEEAAELLAGLETSLLELEKKPADAELIGEIFRAMHTIKGSGAMFGFDKIAAFTHELETVYDRIRAGELTVTGELISLSLSACDRIRIMLDRPDTPEEDAARKGILADLERITGAPSSPPEKTMETSVSGAEPADSEITYRIAFRAHEEVFKRGTDPLLLLAELEEMGPCTAVAHTREIPTLETFDPELCYTSWDVILTTDRGMDAIRDVFIFVEDECEIGIEPIDGAGIDASKKLGRILIERGELSPEALDRALASQKRLGEILVDEGIVAQSPVQSALAEQEHLGRVREKKRDAAAGSIRVATDKLDTLVDLVGELVTIQARLAGKAAGERDPELTAISEAVEHIAGELRDNTMSIRMLSIGTTFNKFHRLVRDLSASLGKEVTMTTSGGETELDKTMIEKLGDPLVHILRNSIDHGIGTPEEREAMGKPAGGNVHLSAEHSGQEVLIRISDDGMGLDPSAIRAKAEAKGLIPSDAQLSDREIFPLIFEPGFSTAVNVSNVSGRGVGMDVVKRAIEGMRGTIEIDSTRGQGTVITLKLPLTLAIIDGLLVETAGVRYVLPLSFINECVELKEEDEKLARGRNILDIRGDTVPFIHLRDRFEVPGKGPSIQRVIVNTINGRKVGLVVDRVIGEQQIMIKTMSRLYGNVKEVSGATILGDGTVALILDVPKLIEEDVRRTSPPA